MKTLSLSPVLGATDRRVTPDGNLGGSVGVYGGQEWRTDPVNGHCGAPDHLVPSGEYTVNRSSHYS